MKLCCPEVVRVDNRCKIEAVIRRCQSDVRGFGLDVIRVHEVDEAARVDAGEKPVRLSELELIPSHVRHDDGVRNATYSTGNDVEAAMQTKLFAFRKDEVHAKTDAECGNAFAHPREKRLDETESLQVVHRVPEGAYAGKD